MQQNPMNLNVPFDKTTEIVCESCGHNVFTEGLLLRKVSRFIVGTDKDALIPIPVTPCQKCGHINKEFMPLEMKKDDSVGSFE